VVECATGSRGEVPGERKLVIRDNYDHDHDNRVQEYSLFEKLMVR
jgi:hypothetical protein